MKPFGRETQPVEAGPSPLEVVDCTQGKVGVAQTAAVNYRSRQAGARDAVDDNKILRREWLDPVLDDVDSADAPTRRHTDDLNRWRPTKPVEVVQMGSSPESGVEPGPHERGDHHLPAPRLRRPADAYHSGNRLVDDRGSDERLNLTSG